MQITALDQLVTSPVCRQDVRDAGVRELRELRAELEKSRRELSQWPEKWDATIDTYSSLLHKEQDKSASLEARVTALENQIRELEGDGK